MGRMSRDKGNRGELEVVELFRLHGWPRAHRNFQSGGQGGSDIVHGPESIVPEVKRTERFELRKTWAQVNEAAHPGELPVIFHRWNNGPWLAILEAEELLPLLALRERG